VRKFLFILTGILFFYVIRLFFKIVMRSIVVKQPSSDTSTGQTIFTHKSGKSYNTDREIEDAKFVEIGAESSK
jgi:hypothetical protein